MLLQHLFVELCKRFGARNTLFFSRLIFTRALLLAFNPDS